MENHQASLCNQVGGFNKLDQHKINHWQWLNSYNKLLWVSRRLELLKRIGLWQWPNSFKKPRRNLRRLELMKRKGLWQWLNSFKKPRRSSRRFPKRKKSQSALWLSKNRLLWRLKTWDQLILNQELPLLPYKNVAPVRQLSRNSLKWNLSNRSQGTKSWVSP